MKLGRQVALSEARKPSSHSPVCLLVYATQNGWKPTILMEEMGQPYDYALVDFAKNEQKSDAFLKINPNGRIPALIDREAGVDVAESAVILEYLAMKFKSPLLPPPEGDSLALHLKVRQWVAWQISGLGPMMGQAMYFQRIAAVKGQKDDFAIGRFRAEGDRLLKMLDDLLKETGGPFLLGQHVTLADVACFPYCASAYWANIELSDKPHLSAWLDMLHERPSFARGLTIPFARPAFFGPPRATQQEIDEEIARNAGQFKVVTK